MAGNLSNMDFSLVSGQQETSVGLFQSKFDFSLVKLEAPIEYQGLGRHLSSKRKIEAEDGTFHITAQKLGALFVDDLPQIPKLKQAYGARSSDIAEDPKLNPNGNADHGPFAAHVGADGTSLWAAATSGPGALEVHLLACILARVWSSAEATSIWDELVSVRKQVLTDRLNEDRFPFTAPMTSRTDISREHLADWDASARSWLRVADKAMKKQQTQLMLIIENIGLSIPSRPKVYDSVIDAWTTSLSIMERLVSGVAQRVQTPEALLGLSSWHIYPDMIVLGTETVSVQQDDSLIQKGGVVTLGMRSARSDNDVGIMWTMPLSRLRFYGKPTYSSRSVGPSSSRVPFFRIVQVALGSAISRWGRNNSDFDKVCHLLISLDKRRDMDLQYRDKLFFGRSKQPSTDNLVRAVVNSNSTQSPMDTAKHLLVGIAEETEWCKLFSDQARSFLSAHEVEKKEFLRHINLGKRLDANFGTNFLAASNKHPEPMFGLSSIPDLLNLLDIEGQIKVLRHISMTFDTKLDAKNCIIVYSHVSNQKGSIPTEYATLLPLQYENAELRSHRRWLQPTDEYQRPSIDEREKFYWEQSDPNNPISTQKLFSWRKRSQDDESAKHLSNYEPAIRRSISLIKTTGEPCGFLGYYEIGREGCGPLLHWHSMSRKPNFRILKQFAQDPSDKLSTEAIIRAWQMGAAPHPFLEKSFRRVLASDLVAIYQSADTKKMCNIKLLPIDYVQEILDSDLPRPLSVAEHLSKVDHETHKHSTYFNSLMALNRASKLYSTLSEADVQLEVVKKCLAETKWAQSVREKELPRRSMTRYKRQVAFACISFFDTGNVDLGPECFDDVLAISSPGSLYVSEALLNDPAEPDNSKICCLIGNIGRPGLALLRSPLGPIFREAEIESWHLVNHSAFDTHLEDNFRATSLQLSLTGSETPIDVNRQSLRDKEVFYAEVTISAHDHGEWIGDINVLQVNDYNKHQGRTLSEWVSPRTIPYVCNHEHGQKHDFTSFGPVVSIDNWWEYLDAPQSPSIVRAKGNYIARLAVAAAQRQRGGHTILAKGAVCWACVARLASLMKMDVERTMIIC